MKPSCKFYYCTDIRFAKGAFSFIWKNERFQGHNGSWDSFPTSARLEGTLTQPTQLRDVHVQVEVLRDRSRGYFTTSQQSRLPSEKFSLLLVAHRTQRVSPLIARIEYIDEQNLQLATSPDHKILMTRARPPYSSWGPKIFHGSIVEIGRVTLYV